jgi:purine catabolism regulator
MAVTLDHLFSVGFFPSRHVLSTDRTLRIPVNSVISATAFRAIADAPADSLVVFDDTRPEAAERDADTAVRVAERSRAAGLLLRRPAEGLAAVTRTLAERSAVAMVLVDHPDPRLMVPAMNRFVQAPETVDDGIVNSVVHRLSTTDDPDAMVRVISTALRCPVALLDPEARVLAGGLTAEPDAVRITLDSQLDRLRPTHWLAALGENMLVVQPIALTKLAPANLWLAAEALTVAPGRVRTVSQVLSVARWAFVAYLASRAVQLDRSSGQSATLLAALLDQASSPSRWVVEAATAAGWRLGGWHSAVHILPCQGSSGMDSPVALELIKKCLTAQGITADPIRREGGWSLWTTAPNTPPAGYTDTLVATLQRALLAAERQLPGLRLCAGVGAGHPGTVGLGRSIQEAHQAALLASAGNIAGVVEQIGSSAAKRLLANYLLLSQQYEIAERTLRPLTVTDPSRQLLDTLACYLDNESSATATAAALGIHRNTVLQRVERIRTLLGVNLADPDERLALQLASRIVHCGPREQDGSR